MCRTLQSLRSLIVGMYDLHDDTAEHDSVLLGRIPKSLAVDTRTKRSETLFPQADGPCAAIAARRAEIMPPSYVC